MKDLKNDANQNKIVNIILIFACIGILASVFGYFMQGKVYDSIYGAIIALTIGLLQKRKLKKNSVKSNGLD